MHYVKMAKKGKKGDAAPLQIIKPLIYLDSLGLLAQLVEQRPFKAWVEGSSPS